MRNVLISYARDDQAAARLIADRLRKDGLSVFVDEASLVAGGMWSAQLSRAMQEASAVVILLSTNSRKGTWVESEVQTALEGKKLVVPVLLDAEAKDNWVWPFVANRRSVALDVESPTVQEQLDHLAAALGVRPSPPTATASVEMRPQPSGWVSRRRIAVLGLVFSLLAGLGVSIEYRRTAYLAQLERERAAQQAAIAEALQQRLARQSEAERFIIEGAQLASTGRISDAIARYTEAIQLNPESPVAHQLLGYAYLRRAQLKRGTEPTDLENAVQSLERAVQQDPEYVWASYNLALAYWEAGRHKDAIAAVRRVLEIDPSFREVIAKDAQFIRFRKSQEFRELLQGH